MLEGRKETGGLARWRAEGREGKLTTYGRMELRTRAKEERAVHIGNRRDIFAERKSSESLYISCNAW